VWRLSSFRGGEGFFIWIFHSSFRSHEWDLELRFRSLRCKEGSQVKNIHLSHSTDLELKNEVKNIEREKSFEFLDRTLWTLIFFHEFTISWSLFLSFFDLVESLFVFHSFKGNPMKKFNSSCEISLFQFHSRLRPSPYGRVSAPLSFFQKGFGGLASICFIGRLCRSRHGFKKATWERDKEKRFIRPRPRWALYSDSAFVLNSCMRKRPSFIFSYKGKYEIRLK